jgi:hypothetical protein
MNSRHANINAIANTKFAPGEIALRLNKMLPAKHVSSRNNAEFLHTIRLELPALADWLSAQHCFDR